LRLLQFKVRPHVGLQGLWHLHASLPWHTHFRPLVLLQGVQQRVMQL
jgi:hypothetical protein